MYYLIPWSCGRYFGIRLQLCQMSIQSHSGPWLPFAGKLELRLKWQTLQMLPLVLVQEAFSLNALKQSRKHQDNKSEQLKTEQSICRCC